MSFIRQPFFLYLCKNNMDCLYNIIGITKKYCECAHGMHSSISYSGLYLDSIYPVFDLAGEYLCEHDGVAIIKESIDLAKKQFLIDAQMLINQKYKAKYKTVTDARMGQITGGDPYALMKNYAVIRIVPKKMQGGIMTIKKVGAIFENDGKIKVKLQHSGSAGALHTLTINTIAGEYVEKTVNWVLSLSKYEEYFLTYEYDDENKPLQNKLNCGCRGFKPVFNLNAPYTNENHEKVGLWANYVMIGGTEANTYNEMRQLPETELAADNNMRGLSIVADFRCDLVAAICKEGDRPENDANYMSKAYAIYYLAAANIMDRVGMSTLLNRELLMREGDDERREEWLLMYKEHLNYLIENIDVSESDCLTCKETSGLYRERILL